jgi:transposase
MSEAITPIHVFGCDVGKTSITVFDSRTNATFTLANRPDALSAFAVRLDDDCLVVCEATGGYEDALLAAILAAGRPAHRADARKVKAFIRSFGTLGKGDRLDARALARYGTERHHSLPRWQAPDPGREHLQALVLARADFVAQRTACNNRLAAPGAHPVRAHLEALHACLTAQIDALDAAIARILDSIETMRRIQRVLRSIKGIGGTTAAALIALMPELGRLGRRQAAALAGLAPHPNQSGASDAYRRTRGGRPEIKRVLFMAAQAAARHHPTLSIAYKRLVAAGKKPIVAITAIMRRLIVIANAQVRDALAGLPQLS